MSLCTYRVRPLDQPAGLEKVKRLGRLVLNPTIVGAAEFTHRGLALSLIRIHHGVHGVRGVRGVRGAQREQD